MTTAWTDATPGPVLSGLRYGSGPLVISPEGGRVALIGQDTLTVWSTETGATVPTKAGPVRSVVFSDDGRRMATVNNSGVASVWDTTSDGTLRIWDATTGERLYERPGASPQTASVSFTLDEHLVTTTDSSTGSVHLWTLP